MTAGFMTSRNKNPILLSSDKVKKEREVQFSPEREEKFFDKRVSTGTRA
eukprot:CAMPEP_0205815894 /NCGR_PEP_ID=MMETSP0205-20121125/21863_1 /ASSEMBLY_ACC=CAM_ASM_000278 /TAXON_ID=36767 /ORGANISM="Euplotes focardii, Strain TN1" /LENGTH=48 /DNA_ID= /DNA_START= /DNA_END= /DNA_ORIENTATION=